MRRKRHIGVGSVKITATGKRYVLKALNANRLSYGAYAEAFEKEFAKLHGRRWALFCNSGTSALQVAFHALKSHFKIKDNAEVIVPAVTFVASVNVLLQNRLKPVFVDVDHDFYMMDPTLVESKISSQTAALEPVHLTGQSADMKPLMKLAKHHKLRVVEDSCEAMFVSYRGKPIGSLGDIACFSTYAAHILVTGVGGFATTSTDELAVKMKSLMNHGRDAIYISIDDDDNTSKKRLFNIVDKRFSYVDVGYSYRATELEAALGLAQIARWEENIKRRQKNAAYLSRGLADLADFLKLPAVRPESEHSFMMYPVVIKKHTKLQRKKLIYHLEEHGIETRFLLPLLNQPVYIKLFGNIEKEYPVAHWLNTHGFYIGSHPELIKADLDYVIEVFHDFFKNV